MQKIVLASGNAGKIRELDARLQPLGIEIIAQNTLAVTEAEENGLSFVENAILKARNACQQTGLPAIADDSGIEVDALQGRPGIHSARFSGECATDTSNNEKLLKMLEGVPENQRSARFQCVLVYMRHGEDPTPLVCQASWEGRIVQPSDGGNGFGYDPLFYIPSEGCTSAELSSERKNTISHRGQALDKLITALSQLP